MQRLRSAVVTYSRDQEILFLWKFYRQHRKATIRFTNQFYLLP